MASLVMRAKKNWKHIITKIKEEIRNHFKKLKKKVYLSEIEKDRERVGVEFKNKLNLNIAIN